MVFYLTLSINDVTQVGVADMRFCDEVKHPFRVTEGGGSILFQSCVTSFLNAPVPYLLQNQTRTTSLSSDRLSLIIRISSEVGFEFLMKAFCNDTRTELSIDVRFLRRLPI